MDDVELDLSPLAEIRISDHNHHKKSSLSHPVDFEQIPDPLFAEQLTYMDSVSTKIQILNDMNERTFTPGFVDRPVRWTEKLDGEPQAGRSDSTQLARIKGVGRNNNGSYHSNNEKMYIILDVIQEGDGPSLSRRHLVPWRQEAH